MTNWYGIPGIGFIYINDYTDPLIQWGSYRFSCYIVEDTMWERYTEEGFTSIEGFADYMVINQDEVKELCDLVIQSMEEEEL